MKKLKPAFHPIEVCGFVHVAVLEEVAINIISLLFAVTLFRIASFIAIFDRTSPTWWLAFVPTLATFLIKECLGCGT